MFVIDKILEKLKLIRAKQKSRFLKFVLAVPFWIIIISLVLLIIFAFKYHTHKYARRDLFVAEDWCAGDKCNMGQVSVYARGIHKNGNKSISEADSGISLTFDDVVNIREQIQKDVNTELKEEKDIVENHDKLKGWTDCYSTSFYESITLEKSEEEKLKETVQKDGSNVLSDSEIENKSVGDNNAANQTQIIAVGGEFELFHPMNFYEGGFLPEDMYNANLIVLNDVLAWQLYSSYDVIGEDVDLLGEEFTIIGICHEDDKAIDATCKILEPRAYIYYTKLDTIINPIANESKTPDLSNAISSSYDMNSFGNDSSAMSSVDMSSVNMANSSAIDSGLAGDAMMSGDITSDASDSDTMDAGAMSDVGMPYGMTNDSGFAGGDVGSYSSGDYTNGDDALSSNDDETSNGNDDLIPDVGDVKSKVKIALQCYEVMIPEHLSGVAKNQVEEKLPGYSNENSNMFVVQNTGRTKLMNILKTSFQKSEKKQDLSGYEFPYWEKAAKQIVGKMFIDLIVIVGAIVLLLIGTLMMILKLRKGNDKSPKATMRVANLSDLTETDIEIE